MKREHWIAFAIVGSLLGVALGLAVLDCARAEPGRVGQARFAPGWEVDADSVAWLGEYLSPADTVVGWVAPPRYVTWAELDSVLIEMHLIDTHPAWLASVFAGPPYCGVTVGER